MVGSVVCPVFQSLRSCFFPAETQQACLVIKGMLGLSCYNTDGQTEQK